MLIGLTTLAVLTIIAIHEIRRTNDRRMTDHPSVKNEPARHDRRALSVRDRPDQPAAATRRSAASLTFPKGELY
jgi:hypothetical protein